MSANDGWARLCELSALADRCPGFAMCRTDFLGIGICRTAIEHRYASYYPQGRLRLIRGLRHHMFPLTPGAVAVAKSCTGCGICDKQCHFTAEIRPMALFQAFRDLVTTKASTVEPLPDDPILQGLARIVGAEWATHDPAHRVAYSGSRSPLAPEALPRYIALPDSSTQVADLVRACAKWGLPYRARGSGTSLDGAPTEGLVIDMVRMDEVAVQPEDCLAKIGPGVLAFDLQKKAAVHSLRANVAEPAACVCANVITTNMHSLFSHAYGLGADHVVDAEFVTPEGTVTRISHVNGPNPFQYRGAEAAPPLGICTGMAIRLFPKSDDERAGLVPCGSVLEAVGIARELAERRVGTALGVLGTTYMAMFAGPTGRGSARVQELLADRLGISCFVLVVGHASVLPALRSVADTVLDHQTIVRLLRALPHLESNDGLQALMDAETGSELFRTLFSEANRPMLNMTLDSGEETFEGVPDDLREFYTKLYRRAELLDPVWLNTFRILPARMGRQHQFVSQIGWVPLRPATAATEFIEKMDRIAQRHHLRGAFGYLTPIDHGTRAVLEFDFYFDQAVPDQRERVRAAMRESAQVLDELQRLGAVVCRGGAIVGQGLARYQSYLFGRTGSHDNRQ